MDCRYQVTLHSGFPHVPLRSFLQAGFHELFFRMNREEYKFGTAAGLNECVHGIDHRMAAKTQSIHRLALKHLLPFLGGKLLCDITAPQIADYQRIRLQSGAQGRTVNIEVATLRQVMKAADLWLPLAGKVRMLRERHDVAKALTPEQEQALLRGTAVADSACHTATILALNTAMRKDEIRLLRWGQIDFENRTLIVGRSKTDAGTGRLINHQPARIRGTGPLGQIDHYVFPWCENRQIDPTRATNGWRTAWRRALKRTGFHCRFHDLRVTCITKLAESQASDMTIMAIAGHVSRKMLEHYSRIRTDAKRAALDAIAAPIFQVGVHQNVHQLEEGVSDRLAKPLNSLVDVRGFEPLTPCLQSRCSPS
jgi:integrase